GSSADESGATFFRKSAVTITTNTGSVLATQFTCNLSDDESSGSRTEAGTAVHNLAFSVTAPGAYSLTVATSRKGDLNRVSEAAVRLGESSTMSSFTAGTYPGSPIRTQANDGHFVTITLISLCGNATTDSSRGEQCDEGANNGQPGSCCTSACQFVSSGTECR